MTYLNRFHQESTERMLRKMEEWKKSPTSSSEAAEKNEAESGKGSAYRGDLYTEQEQIVKKLYTNDKTWRLQ